MSATEDFRLPEDFRFGVATAGFQVEGGYNGPAEPANNWAAWEQSGRVQPSGIALDFWNRYEDHLDRAVDAGCDAFRLSVEWARCEPKDGSFDDTAFDRYRAILSACRERGLQPLVTLHHFTHPAWLGEEFWLRQDAAERFALWVRAATTRLHDLCRHWVTSNELNILAIQSWLTGDFPPGGIAQVGKAVRALDHLLAAHVLAYGEIHAIQPDACAATNNFTFSVYELDRLLTDLLLCRRHGVARPLLGEWLSRRRTEYHRAVTPMSGNERFLRWFTNNRIPLDRAFPQAVDSIYASPHACTDDVIQTDYYAPVVSRHLRRPGHPTAGGRNWMPAGLLWDDLPDPNAFADFTRLQVEPGLPLWIVENGLCNRVLDGKSLPRLDGWDRPRYLKAHLRAVVEMIDHGVPLGGYYHWTLADNYEWGSYEPRFGLYGIDRAKPLEWSPLDAMGQDSAGAFRRLVDGLRAGDRSVVQ